MDERTFQWAVPVDLPAFAGHFPGQPIVPGVLLIDQALLFASRWLESEAGLWRIGQAKFLQPAGPGDALEFRMQRRADGGIAFRIVGAGGDIASGSLSCSTPAP